MVIKLNLAETKSAHIEYLPLKAERNATKESHDDIGM